MFIRRLWRKKWPVSHFWCWKVNRLGLGSVGQRGVIELRLDIPDTPEPWQKKIA